MIEIIPADRRLRLLAAIIDALVVSFIWGFVLLYFGERTENLDGGYTYNVEGLPALLLFAGTCCYYIVPEILYGQTFGKSLFNLKVISEDGNEDIDFKQAFLRHLCDIVDWFPFFGIVFYIVTGNNPKKQRVGDMAAKTVVISTKRKNK
jgi:uncharacterized RDD family membrane protein YckC